MERRVPFNRSMKISDRAACHTGEAKQNKSGIRKKKKEKKNNVDIDYFIRKNDNDIFVKMPLTKSFIIRSKCRASVRCITADQKISIDRKNRKDNLITLP